MKPQPIFKWLVLVGSSALLSLSVAHADPDADKKNDSKGKTEKSEKKNPGKAERKAERKDGKKGPSKAERAERRENQQERAERKEDKRERIEDRKERVEDRREQAEDRRERIEDQRERAEDRQERRIYKRGEFRERFVDRDRDHIVTYFSGHKGHSHGLPPGLAAKWDNGRRLPAGWRDRVVTGYVIEDEWRPYFEPVPYSWFPGITVVPDTQLYWYGDRVVRVYEPTREVVDVVVVPTIHIDL